MERKRASKRCSPVGKGSGILPGVMIGMAPFGVLAAMGQHGASVAAQ